MVLAHNNPSATRSSSASVALSTGSRISCPEVDGFVFRTTHLVTTDPSIAAMSAEAVQAGRLDACPTQATCRHGTLIRG
jgi:hypothetical protein